MDSTALSALERVIEPYRQAGYTIMAQSEGAITLIAKPKKFNYMGFIFALLLFWPAAIIYLIIFNNRGDRSVCVRITSTGNIEETGYTLAVANKERSRDRLISIITVAVPLLMVLVFVLLRMWSRNLLPSPR
jgi:hypothetical protein